MGVSDLLFPNGYKCFLCGKEIAYGVACEECFESLPFIKGHTCIKCGVPVAKQENVCIDCKGKSFSFESNVSVFLYDGAIRNKMSSFKFKGEKYIGDSFAYFIKEKFINIDTHIDVIIPVPIGADRLKERGYNQSEILVKLLNSELHKDVSSLLVRLSNIHQTGLNRTNRRKNLKGVFKVTDKSAIKGKVVLVVDDIYTTGSTLNECAEVLINAGASKVYGLTLCRTPINYEKILM